MPPYVCGVDDSYNNAGPRSVPCTPTSDTWLNQYRLPEYWIPDATTPIKTVLVNWVVCQDSAGNGWQDIPEFHQRVQMFFDSINNIYTNIPLKGYTLTCDPSPAHVYDSRIRFELGEIYFLQNDNWHDLPSMASEGPILNYLFSIHPEAKNALNHIFNIGESQTGELGYYRHNVNGESIVRTANPSLMFSDWWLPMEFTGHFAHEYGHALGIHHTYNGEYKNTTYFDFLDDVFGTCVEPMLIDVNHTCYDSLCNPSSNEICYLKACFWNQHDPPYPLMWGGMVNNDYISPKMAGRFHRALSLYDETFRINNKHMHRYVKEKYAFPIAKEINQNETWDFAIKMYQDIIVKAGNTLTISCEVKMPIGGKIIVEPNATLIVDGGRITSAHADFWQGIEVWGNYNLPQTTANQGRLIVRNDAIIENAENAVSVWKPGDWATTGGIIEATNSTFRNNRRSIAFLAYQNLQSNGFIAPNRSYFKNCTFETNDDLLLGDIQGNQTMFTMHKVNGVRILGCDFIYNRTVSAYTDLKSAINTSDANFRVDNSCSTLIPIGQSCPPANIRHSTFTGFDNAIHVTSATWNVGPEIKDAVFSKNMVGINFDAVTAPAAIFNEFTVGNSEYTPYDLNSPDFNLGIKVNNCDEYIIEENEFVANNSLGWATHGVYTFDENNYTNSNELYKNSYSGLASASIVEGRHSEPPVNNESYIGLRFVCNLNQNNTNDFELRVFNGSDYSRISTYQNGGANLPAGNTFSVGNAGDNIYTHLDFFSNIKYNYMKRTGDTDPKASETYITSPGNISIASLEIQNTCPTNYPVSGGILSPEFTLGKFIDERDEYGNLRYTYLQLLDDGNTDGMIAEINLSWPEDAWELHNELMDRSPYNSETVLIAAAEKNILTHGMLLEILLTNPDALRSGEVLKYVQYDMAAPLPQYMIDILQNAANDPGTVRSIMEKNLSDLHFEMIRTHKHITHKQLNDTINGFHPDTLLQYFSSIRTLAGRYQQIYAYTGMNQYSNAIAVIDSIINNYRLENEQAAELGNTKDFIYFLEALYNDGRNVAQLDSAEIAELTLISNEKPGGQAAERAENILCFFYEQCKIDIGSPKNNGVKTKRPMPTVEELYEGLNTVNVAPNPAKIYVEFEYSFLIAAKTSVLRIYDVHGKPIMSWNIGISQRGLKVLDTRKMVNGVYIYELVQDGKKVDSGKFIVQH